MSIAPPTEIAPAQIHADSNLPDEKEEEQVNQPQGATECREEIDMKALAKVIHNWETVWEMLDKEFWMWDKEKKEYVPNKDKDAVLTFIKNIYYNKKTTNTVRYGFSGKLKSGRRYAEDNSLQGMNRRLRHTIAKNIYHDIDMKNAQPTFLRHLCKTLGFNHPVLEAYCDNRDAYLEKWVGTKVFKGSKVEVLQTKDDAKKFFLAITNGGKQHCQTDNDDLNQYFHQHQQFLEVLWKHPEYRLYRKRAENSVATKKKAFEARKKAGKVKEWETFFDNRKGSCLNYYMADIENLALVYMEEKLKQLGIEYGALCFDGIMVYQVSTGMPLPDLLAQLEAYLLEKMGFVIKLSCKPMDEELDLSELPDPPEEILDVFLNATDEDYAGYILKAMEGNYLYNQDKEEMLFYDEETALWFPRKSRHLMTFISDILSPLIETYAIKRNDWVKCLPPFAKETPEVIQQAIDTFRRKQLELIRSYTGQNRIVKMCEPQIEKRKDDAFIREHLDRKKGFYPIANKQVINLATGEIRERLKDDYFTKTTERRIVEVSPETRDFILNYYEDVLSRPNQRDDEEKMEEEERKVERTRMETYRDCLIYTCAYMLTGENHLKKFINFIGKADGGKSCFLNNLHDIMGEFAGQANKRLFVLGKSESNHDTEMFSLLGKRMSGLSETTGNQKFNEELIKKISGGDPVDIRRACGTHTIQAYFDTILLLATNNICQFNDPAFMTRLMCFNFCNVFKKDASVPLKLKSLKDEFFTILCEYAKKFYDNGKTFPIAPEVEQYTSQICEEQDTIKMWLDSEKTYEEGKEDDWCEKTQIFDDYCAFMTGTKRERLAKQEFVKQFEERFNLQKVEKKRINGRLCYAYKCLKRVIQDHDDQPDPEQPLINLSRPRILNPHQA